MEKLAITKRYEFGTGFITRSFSPATLITNGGYAGSTTRKFQRRSEKVEFKEIYL